MNDFGYIEMYSAHINLCIDDFIKVHKIFPDIKRRVKEDKKWKRREYYIDLINKYNTAKWFLFEGGLDDAIERFSLPLDADYLRRYTMENVKDIEKGVNMPLLTCKVCKYRWYPFVRKPKKCPNCQSRKWQSGLVKKVK